MSSFYFVFLDYPGDALRLLLAMYSGIIGILRVRPYSTSCKGIVFSHCIIVLTSVASFLEYPFLGQEGEIGTLDSFSLCGWNAMWVVAKPTGQENWLGIWIQRDKHE